MKFTQVYSEIKRNLINSFNVVTMHNFVGYSIRLYDELKLFGTPDEDLDYINTISKIFFLYLDRKMKYPKGVTLEPIKTLEDVNEAKHIINKILPRELAGFKYFDYVDKECGLSETYDFKTFQTTLLPDTPISKEIKKTKMLIYYNGDSKITLNPAFAMYLTLNALQDRVNAFDAIMSNKETLLEEFVPRNIVEDLAECSGDDVIIFSDDPLDMEVRFLIIAPKSKESGRVMNRAVILDVNYFDLVSVKDPMVSYHDNDSLWMHAKRIFNLEFKLGKIGHPLIDLCLESTGDLYNIAKELETYIHNNELTGTVVGDMTEGSADIRFVHLYLLNAISLGNVDNKLVSTWANAVYSEGIYEGIFMKPESFEFIKRNLFNYFLNELSNKYLTTLLYNNGLEIPIRFENDDKINSHSASVKGCLTYIYNANLAYKLTGSIMENEFKKVLACINYIMLIPENFAILQSPTVEPKSTYYTLKDNTIQFFVEDSHGNKGEVSRGINLFNCNFYNYTISNFKWLTLTSLGKILDSNLDTLPLFFNERIVSIVEEDTLALHHFDLSTEEFVDMSFISPIKTVLISFDDEFIIFKSKNTYRAKCAERNMIAEKIEDVIIPDNRSLGKSSMFLKQ